MGGLRLALGVLVALAGRLFHFQEPGQNLLLAHNGFFGQALVYEVGFGLFHQLFYVAGAAATLLTFTVFAVGTAGFVASLSAGVVFAAGLPILPGFATGLAALLHPIELLHGLAQHLLLAGQLGQLLRHFAARLARFRQLLNLLVELLLHLAELAGAGVHVWHATADGRYSMYSDGVSDENFLRGVQEAAADGTVTFQTIYTGCYDGRWPHIHFEVFSDLASATNGGNAIATSQLAFPRETCEVVYTAEGYESSVGNLERVSLERDNVFSDDGAGKQLATMSGDNVTGWTGRLTVAV